MPAMLTADRRNCNMQMILQGLSCWKEDPKACVLAGKELKSTQISVITLRLGFDSLGDQKNIRT